jgi:pseudouridine-5'-phosphate glycosidase
MRKSLNNCQWIVAIRAVLIAKGMPADSAHAMALRIAKVHSIPQNIAEAKVFLLHPD